MIEIEKSKTGVPVLKSQGRFLASSFDPINEARTWLDKGMPQLQAGEAAVVLGAGSGYHLAELKARRPGEELLVIECDPDVRDACLKICPTLEESDFLLEGNWMKLPDSPRFRDVVCGVYQVLMHGPSLQIHTEYFRSVERLLKGRDKLSFLVLLKTRPDLLAHLSAPAVGAIANEEAISIKTVCSLFAPQAQASRDRRLWRVLEELVI